MTLLIVEKRRNASRPVDVPMVMRRVLGGADAPFGGVRRWSAEGEKAQAVVPGGRGDCYARRQRA